ncbi:MAG: hypothetical protein ACYSUC_11410 [Planctomycetota bacterium]|jgi:hypothetical protein
MIYLWIALHVVLGVVAALVLPVWGLIGFAFWLREMGELKHQMPGSIASFDKNIRMIAATFGRPRILAQWILPMIAVLIMEYWR